MNGRVTGLWLHVTHDVPMKRVSEARAKENHGLEGCTHAQPGKKRQVLLMDEETLAEFGLVPAQIKENITTRGIAIQSLPAGARVRVGEAELEIVMPCEPCRQIEAIRPGLKKAMDGKRGVLARVTRTGSIKVGDQIEALGPK